MADPWLFVFQIRGESIMLRFWLSVKLEMDIRQTKQSARQGACVSAFQVLPFKRDIYIFRL